MKCENCNEEHDGSYASGRFCSPYCYHSYVNKNFSNTPEKRKQKSIKEKGKPHPHVGYHPTPEQRKRQIEGLRKNREYKLSLLPFEKLSYDRRKKIIMEEQNNLCNKCQNNFIWLGIQMNPIVHHKDGNRKNNCRENQEVLCHNCHSITEFFGFVGRHRKEGKGREIGLKGWKTRKTRRSTVINAEI